MWCWIAVDRLRAVAALADHLHVLFLLQQRQHALARHRLVVDDQGSNLAHATLSVGQSLERLRPSSSHERNHDGHRQAAAGRRAELEPVDRPGTGARAASACCDSPTPRLNASSRRGRHAVAVVLHLEPQQARRCGAALMSTRPPPTFGAIP